MLCLFIATNCSKLATDADAVRSSANDASASRNADDGRLWAMMSDLSSAVHQQNAEITARTTEFATRDKKVTTLSAEVNALKAGYNSPPGFTPNDSEKDGFRKTKAERMSDGTDGIGVPHHYVLRSEFKIQQDEINKLNSRFQEFKIQQDEINKLRRLIGCYHGIVKPIVYSGTAGASSTWSAKYAPQNAFENSDDRWVSGKLGDGPRRPELYFNFTSEVTVAMIGLTTATAWGQAPKSFELIASMDCGNWHVLRYVVDHIWPHGNEEFIWTIPCDLIKPWKCYGIRATAHSGSRHDCVSVKEMKMFTIQGWQKRPDIRPDATEGGKEDQ